MDIASNLIAWVSNLLDIVLNTMLFFIGNSMLDA